MPKKKPPRLWLRPARSARRRADGERKTEKAVWIIIDGTRQVSTGCSAAEIEQASESLSEYIAERYRPAREGDPNSVPVADILLIYDEDVADSTSRPKETRQRLMRLNDFFGSMMVSELRGKACREYAQRRGTAAGARRELQDLQAALTHYNKEHGLDFVPKLTLPPKSLPRERYMTRKEAAGMLRACRRVWRGSHIARLVILGIYTGTRPGALLPMQWAPNTSGGWVDLERGVMYRRAEGERVAHNKRKTPVRLPNRALAHLRRWKRLDEALGGDLIRFVVHYQGKQVKSISKAWRSIRKEASLSADITPHILRHTRGTWLAQKSVPPHKAAESLGITTAEYERTYLHFDPEFQQEAANAY